MAAAQASDLKSLSVLYVGDSGSPRAKSFSSLIEPQVKRFQSASRTDFAPFKADGYDVVVLDWPQGIDNLKGPDAKAPLGPRETWDKPTVLLGSAGLNLAVVWKVRGGSG